MPSSNLTISQRSLATPITLHLQLTTLGWERICMPSVAFHLRSNDFRPKVKGNPGEGEVFNIHTNLLGEPDAAEKEMFLGIQ